MTRRPKAVIAAILLTASCGTQEAARMQAELDSLRSKVAAANAGLPELEESVRSLERQLPGISEGHMAISREQAKMRESIESIGASLEQDRLTTKMLSERAETIAADVRVVHSIPLELSAAVKANQALLRETTTQIEAIRAQLAAALDLQDEAQRLREEYIVVLEAEQRLRTESLAKLKAALDEMRGSESVPPAYMKTLETECRLRSDSVSQINASLRRLRGEPPEVNEAGQKR